MIFELCDFLKEQITEINDGVVGAIKMVSEKENMTNALKASEASSIKHLTYTPVTAETFAKWCEEYKKRLKLERDSRLTEWDSKPTGRQLFLLNRQGLDDLMIDEDEETSEVLIEAEEVKQEQEDEDEEEFKYDRALYDADELEEEVDFEDN